MSASDDDSPQLSAHSLAALTEFLQEQAELAQNEERGNTMPQEDWNLSQFWYNENTAEKLALEALAAAGPSGRIACVSCPTLYQKLKQLQPDCDSKLLEYDTKFKQFGSEFVFYDYNEPLKIPEDFRNAFDIVVADPPFLSEECLTKTATTIKFMAKEKIILCTGATMEDLAERLLKVKVCRFQPKHARNLANVFYCYSNYVTTHLDEQS